MRIRRHVVEACGGLADLDGGLRSQAQKFIVSITDTVQLHRPKWRVRAEWRKYDRG